MNRFQRIPRDGIVEFHFFLPQERIGYARFILEGYDNLGTQTSVPDSSRVVWTIPADLQEEAERLLECLMNGLQS